MTTPLLVNREQLAELLGVSEGTIRKLEIHARLPGRVRLTSKPQWAVNEIRAWVDAGCPAKNEWARLRSESA